LERALPDSIKLGFQSHFPQLETKLAAVANTEAELDQILAPAEAKIRDCFGNFILCEDDQTLENLIIDLLGNAGATLSAMDMSSGGNLCKRLVNADRSGNTFKSGIVSRSVAQLAHAADTTESKLQNEDLHVNTDTARALAESFRQRTNSDYALIVLIAQEPIDETPPIATKSTTIIRQARMMGGQEWIQLGSTEMALDSLRRFLLDMPVDEKTDFEQQ